MEVCFGKKDVPVILAKVESDLLPHFENKVAVWLVPFDDSPSCVLLI